MNSAIMWIENGWLRIRFTFDNYHRLLKVIEGIKKKVPPSERKYRPKPENIWEINPRYLDEIYHLIESHGYEITVIEQRKESDIDCGINSNVHSKFIDLIPNDILKRLYRELMMIYHPDHGGDQEKAKELNECWDIIKKERRIT